MPAQTPLFRYVRARSGWLLIGCLILFGTAVLQAGLLQGLFKSVLSPCTCCCRKKDWPA